MLKIFDWRQPFPSSWKGEYEKDRQRTKKKGDTGEGEIKEEKENSQAYQFSFHDE